jgi:arachidonate 15-lipoxygenase
VSEDGGALHGLTPSGEIRGFCDLVDVVAQFLLLAGPGHAAVHFPQTAFLTYPPFFPGGAFRPPPAPDEVVDADRIRQTLPPVGVGLVQFMTNQIANYRFDRFGDLSGYAVSRVSRASRLIARLRADLQEVECTIELRNQRRRRPYRYLLPSRVPNSINI